MTQLFTLYDVLGYGSILIIGAILILIASRFADRRVPAKRKVVAMFKDSTSHIELYENEQHDQVLVVELTDYKHDLPKLQKFINEHIN